MFDDVYEIIEKSFVEHKETFDADNPRDFMDVFIKQMQTAEEVKIDYLKNEPNFQLARNIHKLMSWFFPDCCLYCMCFSFVFFHYEDWIETIMLNYSLINNK